MTLNHLMVMELLQQCPKSNLASANKLSNGFMIQHTVLYALARFQNNSLGLCDLLGLRRDL
jgi:hypothetical protein